MTTSYLKITIYKKLKFPNFLMSQKLKIFFILIFKFVYSQQNHKNFRSDLYLLCYFWFLFKKILNFDNFFIRYNSVKDVENRYFFKDS